MKTTEIIKLVAENKKLKNKGRSLLEYAERKGFDGMRGLPYSYFQELADIVGYKLKE